MDKILLVVTIAVVLTFCYSFLREAWKDRRWWLDKEWRRD